MKDDSMMASNDRKNKNEEVAKRPDCKSEPQRLGFQSETSDLRFDRLQPSDEEVECNHKRVFRRYIAREALLDEELWTAAWLRAECHWVDRSDARHVDTFKRQFAQQEFNAIKRRCTGRQLAEKSTCIIVVKKEDTNVKRTVLSSIVGTLDMNIRHPLCGETFPGDLQAKQTFGSGHEVGGLYLLDMKYIVSNQPLGAYEGLRILQIFERKDQSVYGYIANLSVAKYARRQGIASNMLLLAVEAAKSYGANEVFLPVYKDNVTAWKLYEKLGFEMVEKAISQSVEEQKFLLCLKT